MSADQQLFENLNRELENRESTVAASLCEAPDANDSTSLEVTHQSRAAQALLRSGDISVVAPPVPIPNTEVKRCSPDGSTAKGRARVGRRQNKNPGELTSSGFLLSGVGYSSREHGELGSRRVDSPAGEGSR